MAFEEVQIGDCRLILGDCREALPLLPAHDLLLTDPPYGIEGTWSGGNSHGWGRFSGDAEPWDTRPDWFAEWALQQQESKKIIWGGQYFKLEPSGSWLVWDKLVRKFSSGHCELAWTDLKKPIRAFNFSHGELATEGKEHPTQKPLTLILWCLDMVSDARTVLDPFMGSGTTGVACAIEGKTFTGIERERKYFDIACRRIEEAYKQPRLFQDNKPPAPEQAVLV